MKFDNQQHLILCNGKVSKMVLTKRSTIVSETVKPTIS